MLPQEFLETRDAFPLCYVGFGLAEPHGAYNALGLDWLKATALIEKAALLHGGMVAPPCAWHIQELPHFHGDGSNDGWLRDAGIRQPLCSSIPADLFYRMVFYQIRAVDARGFRAALLVTGHYGGVEIVLRKICEYYLRKTNSPLRLAAIADWECIDADLPHRGDHAGICETSQLMELHPGLTDLRFEIANTEIGERFGGGVDFVRGPVPSRKIGRTIVESQVRNLGHMAKELIAEYLPREKWKAPNFPQIETIWQSFEDLTRSYWSLTYSEYKNGRRIIIPDWDDLEG